MKYLKHYEEIEINPQIYDYVYCYDDDHADPGYQRYQKIRNEYFRSNIGQITKIKIPTDDDEEPGYPNETNYYVTYESWNAKLDDICNYPVPFKRHEILEFSKNKEALEHLISANKYNL